MTAKAIDCKENGTENEAREKLRVEIPQEDMEFLGALIHPQPPKETYSELMERVTALVWTSDFEDAFSIRIYETRMVSAVLVATEGCDYCDPLRLMVHDPETGTEHSLVWEDVDFIRKTEEGIEVSGCCTFWMDGETVKRKVYDLLVTEGGI
jgi:hypothetical protein